MKSKFILLSTCLLLFSQLGFSQKGKPDNKDSENDKYSIIANDVKIKYHRKNELEKMNKGQLLELYQIRIEAIVKVLPYIAFATKPGVSMFDLGIPTNSDNVKFLEDQFKATDAFLDVTREFQSNILPYADTSRLIFSILFYEETMKSLHLQGEFN